MIEVENKFDFDNRELEDILMDMPERITERPVDAQANYILRQLNVNRILKEHVESRKMARDRSTESVTGPYHITITRTCDGSRIFDDEISFAAIIVHSDSKNRIEKCIVSMSEVKDADLENICELISGRKGWTLKV